MRRSEIRGAAATAPPARVRGLGGRAASALPALILVLAGAAPSAAQAPAPPPAAEPDTPRVYALDPVVVTSARSPARLATSTAAVSVLRSEDLHPLPVSGIADVLQHGPGLAFLDFDGLGGDPQPTVRGFYGGGEAEYVVVLLDGQPLNGFEDGGIDWEVIPLAAIERIEVLRGGASALYGDAAVGAVVNLITRAESSTGAVRWSLAAGEHGILRAAAARSTDVSGRRVSVFGELRRSDGFREHASRRTGTLGGSVGLLEGPAGSLALSAFGRTRRFDEPGPVTADALAASRTGTSPFFRFDDTAERTGRLGLDGRLRLGSGARVSAHLSGETRGSDATRTLVLSPGFADTKDRGLRADRLLASVQVDGPGLPLAWEDRVLIGADASAGRMESSYYTRLSGDAETYAAAEPRRGELDARGAGSREGVGAFARYELRLGAVRLSGGGRVDWLRDAFEPAGAEAVRASHTAFSPGAGINVRYLGGARHQGHLYGSVSRSFKAPTLDQLFDQRTIPVPFDPWRISVSNALLEPQTGTSFEAGLYHRAQLASGAVAAELSLAAYRTDMENELDFDLQEFRYVNIGRSRHDGLEAGLSARVAEVTRVFLNYTLQEVTARHGEHAGRRLKAIPRHFTSGGVSAGRGSGPAAGLTFRDARGIYLDDANTVSLPGYTRVDAKISYPIRGVRVFLEVLNVFDATYSTTGFPDPSDPDTVYYYPAAGRVLQLGIGSGG